MAAVATLYWLNIAFINADDGSAIRASLPLLEGDPISNKGWHIEKWIPDVAKIDASGNAGLVTEKITCLVNATNKAGLEDELADLALMAQVARKGARDTSSCSVVYLAMSPSGGVNINAYLHNINYKVLETLTDSCGHIAENRIRVQLEIIREPYWEERSYDSKDTGPGAAASITIDYRDSGVNIPCSAPVRMTNLYFYPNNVGDEIGRLWIGLRTDRQCADPSQFVPIWELEDGTNNAAESGITDDAATDQNGASPGNGSGKFVKLIPTDLTWDDTWNRVLTITMSDIIGAERIRAQFGFFKWLLRSMVTAGEWQVQLKYGYTDMDDDDFVEGRITDIDNTNWDYFDMGQRQVPFRDSRTMFGDALFAQVGSESEEFTIQIWARRTSGAGNLYLDCLCPVPMDEGYFIAKDCGASKNGGTEIVVYTESPYRTTDCLVQGAAGDMRKSVNFEASNFNFAPNCEGFMVVVYAQDDQSVLTDRIVYSGYYTKRWLTIRGT